MDTSVDAVDRTVRSRREEEVDLRGGEQKLGRWSNNAYSYRQQLSVAGFEEIGVDATLPDSDGISEESVAGIGNPVRVLRDVSQPPSIFAGQEALSIVGGFRDELIEHSGNRQEDYMVFGDEVEEIKSQRISQIGPRSCRTLIHERSMLAIASTSA
jgi:hypothetical protein